MSWLKISMKFPGKCIVCQKDIAVGASVMWSKGEGVKHESCANLAIEIACAVCGRKAGCSECELREDCDLERVSQLCICHKCSAEDALAKYITAVNKKFQIPSSDKKINQSTLM